ncbi:hypothetical protein [Methylobacterium durans]|nr:hypothetical protein [Methylobacterium durans]
MMRRDEFAVFPAAGVEVWRAERADQKLMRLTEINAKGMALEPLPNVRN